MTSSGYWRRRAVRFIVRKAHSSSHSLGTLALGKPNQGMIADRAAVRDNGYSWPAGSSPSTVSSLVPVSAGPRAAHYYLDRTSARLLRPTIHARAREVLSNILAEFRQTFPQPLSVHQHYPRLLPFWCDSEILARVRL